LQIAGFEVGEKTEMFAISYGKMANIGQTSDHFMEKFCVQHNKKDGNHFITISD